MAAARPGIHCRLMLDSAGSVAFFRSPWPELMRNAGIEVVEALKVNLMRVFLRRMDLRQHRKMIMIDNYIAYTGSMNMVDPRYFKQDAGVGQWIDLMARMEGPIATAMGIIYSCDWEIEPGKRILPPPPDVNIMPFEQASGHTIHTIASGPGFPEDLIHQALLTAAYSAREYLIMTTPYFVPSDDLLHAICTAAQRGVDVSIILPRKNDSMLVGWASRAFFTELLAAGVKIYQFEGGLLHTKSVLVDGELSLVGTVNLDMRSLWLNFEITLAIDDKGFGADLAAVQDDLRGRGLDPFPVAGHGHLIPEGEDHLVDLGEQRHIQAVARVDPGDDHRALPLGDQHPPAQVLLLDGVQQHPFVNNAADLHVARPGVLVDTFDRAVHGRLCRIAQPL